VSSWYDERGRVGIPAAQVVVVLAHSIAVLSGLI